MSYSRVSISFEHPEKKTFKATIEDFNNRNKKRIKQVDIYREVSKKFIENPELIAKVLEL
jgi:hypothetical protein